MMLGGYRREGRAKSVDLVGVGALFNGVPVMARAIFCTLVGIELEIQATPSDHMTYFDGPSGAR
jgi:hypothetical protein